MTIDSSTVDMTHRSTIWLRSSAAAARRSSVPPPPSSPYMAVRQPGQSGGGIESLASHLSSLPLTAGPAAASHPATDRPLRSETNCCIGNKSGKSATPERVEVPFTRTPSQSECESGPQLCWQPSHTFHTFSAVLSPLSATPECAAG